MAPIEAGREADLKVSSVAGFYKLTTLDRAIIAGKLGDASPSWLAEHRNGFFGVFGFREE